MTRSSPANAELDAAISAAKSWRGYDDSWINRDAKALPGASPDAVFMLGTGGHFVWIDPELDAVVVLRWLDPQHAHGVIRQFAQALVPRQVA